jgi:hypothetical protein
MLAAVINGDEEIIAAVLRSSRIPLEMVVDDI